MSRRILAALAVALLVVLAIACGVTVSGRIDVGPDTPSASPCPEARQP